MTKQSILIVLLTLSTLTLPAQKQFDFFAIGDMPYHNPEDIEKFKTLAQTINSEKPAFTIHVGDIKNGSTNCSDDYNKMILGLFSQFKGPLIYTPGDNEWTDCHRKKAGEYDPLERLSALRNLFFNNGESLGQRQLKVRSVAEIPGFETFVENVLWRKGGVTFGTVHVVGSNNNFKPDHGLNGEFLERDAANIHWLSEIFSTAKSNADAAVVIIMHGAMVYEKKEHNGYANLVEKLKTEVTNFKKPVLLIYGDHHRFQITKPLMDAEDNLIQNFTALMVFGDSEMNAVKIHVNPKSKEVFRFSEYLMEYN